MTGMGNALRRILAALARAIDSLLAEKIEPIPMAKVIALPLPPGDVPAPVVAEQAILPAPVSRPSPLFVLDLSHWDGDVDVDKIIANRSIVGVWVKLTQGSGGYTHEAYGVALVKRLIAAAQKAGRLGVDFWIGGYGFVNFDGEGGAQANYLFRAHRAAGLLDIPAGARLRALMDVERGDHGSANYDDAGPKVRACAEAFAVRWKALAGHPPIAYGRGAWEDLHMRGLLGCDGLINPAYTRHMVATDGIGIPRGKVRGWQYSDGETNKTTFPTPPHGDATVVLAETAGQLAGIADVSRLLGW